ncbi:Myc-type, basic helix-loop-helix domain-containing protein [Tanacetum coccineum]
MRRGSSSSQQPSAAKEKARRDRMKDLYSTLASLLQFQPHERMPLPDLLERATTTLKQWQERVECLKSRKKELEESLNDKSSNNIHKSNSGVVLKLRALISATSATTSSALFMHRLLMLA